MTRTLPPELAAYASAIKRTERPIIAAEVLPGPPASMTASRLGGLPWWPAAMPYPTGKDGAPLYLLAQFNFAEYSQLEPFPARGLLQFFLGGTKDFLYGCNLDDLRSPNAFRCIYHADLALAARDNFDVMDPPIGDDDVLLPLATPLHARALQLSHQTMVVTPFDYRMAKMLPLIHAENALMDAYQGYCSAPPIRLGGYPSFTQTDPREFQGDSPLGDFTLLAADSTDGLLWGDVGSGQFLMHERDLHKRDFSSVVYNWDCY